MFINDIVDRFRKQLDDIKQTYRPWDSSGFSSSNSTSMVAPNAGKVNPTANSMAFPVDPANPVLYKQDSLSNMNLGQTIQAFPEQHRQSEAEKASLAAQGMRQLGPTEESARKIGYTGQFHPEAAKVSKEAQENLMVGSMGELKAAGGAIRPVARSMVDEAAQVAKPVVQEAFQGLKDLSTKIVEKLKGKSQVSKQFILDLTNSGDVKQVERDIIRNMLNKEGDKVNVKKFAESVQDELVPLKVKAVKSVEEWGPKYVGNPTKYENVVLQDDVRGPVKNYAEHIYEGPIKTSAGSTHFPGDAPNYFGHTRVEDMADGKTRRVIEVQSDLYQKGGLESELEKKYSSLDQAVKDLQYRGYTDEQAQKQGKILFDSQGGDPTRLSQYNDPTAHFRMIREEVKKAAEDGKSDLLFPTGDTAMKVEGLGVRETFRNDATGDLVKGLDELKVGSQVTRANGSDEWIITEVLGDGKFKAVPKDTWDSAHQVYEPGGLLNEYQVAQHRRIAEMATRGRTETFDISGKMDSNNPIHRFYEKEIGKYLKNKYNAQPYTDENGISWMKVNISKEAAKLPVEAFIAIPGAVLLQDKKKYKKTPPK